MVTRSTLEIYADARKAGFSRDHDEALIATAIALAESGGDPSAHNDNPKTGDDSFGLWQINMFKELGPARRVRRMFHVQGGQDGNADRVGDLVPLAQAAIPPGHS